MKKQEQENNFTVTLRQCIDFVTEAKNLKSIGGFKLRCTIAALAMEATKIVQIHNEGQEPSPGLTLYRTEVNLHRENCTIETDGKKQVDVEAFIPLLESARIKHSKAIAEADKIQRESNKALEDDVKIYCNPIPMSMLEELDQEQKIDITVLSSILPFASV